MVLVDLKSAMNDLSSLDNLSKARAKLHTASYVKPA